MSDRGIVYVHNRATGGGGAWVVEHRAPSGSVMARRGPFVARTSALAAAAALAESVRYSTSDHTVVTVVEAVPPAVVQERPPLDDHVAAFLAAAGHVGVQSATRARGSCSTRPLGRPRSSRRAVRARPGPGPPPMSNISSHARPGRYLMAGRIAVHRRAAGYVHRRPGRAESRPFPTAREAIADARRPARQRPARHSDLPRGAASCARARTGLRTRCSSRAREGRRARVLARGRRRPDGQSSADSLVEGVRGGRGLPVPRRAGARGGVGGARRPGRRPGRPVGRERRRGVRRSST